MGKKKSLKDRNGKKKGQQIKLRLLKQTVLWNWRQLLNWGLQKEKVLLTWVRNTDNR